MTGLRERKKLATREALSRAAMRLAVERGMDRVRVEDIAAEAGVSLRTFNNYFSSKEEAIISIALDRAASISAALRQRPPSQNLADALIQVFVEQYASGDGPDKEWLARLHLAVQTPALLGEYLKQQFRIERTLAKAIAERTGRDLHSRVLAAAVSAAARVAIEYWRESKSKASLASVLRRAIKTVLPLCLCFPALCQTALIVRDVRVFDGERVQEHRSVLIENGKISRVGDAKLDVPKAEIIDGRGRTLLPGLFDAHLHVPAKPEQTLRQLASLGVTTALDMFGGGEKLKAAKVIEAEDPAGMADLRVAGVGATGPGSMMSMMAKQPLPTIAGPEQAQPWVDARIAEGSDYIKVVYDERQGGPMNPETLQAVVQAAHKRGKLVVAHVLDEKKAREAIEAGVDGLAHLFIGDSAGGDFGQVAARHHVFVIPTLTILNGLCGKPQGPALLADSHLAPHITAEQRQSSDKPADASRNHLCRATSEAMRQLLQAHVPILAGTDTGPLTAATYGVAAYGATLHGELKLLVDEGLTPVQALAAATSAPARAFHFADRGSIEPGRRADLVLVEGDPTRDILATRNIVAVWKRGDRIQSH